MGLMDFGRHEGDQITQDFGNTFFEKAKDLSASVVSKVADAARKQNLDPRYLYWVLFQTPSTWGTAAGANRDALDIVVKLHAMNTRRTPVSDRYQVVPEDEARTDAAIKDLANWAAKDFSKRLARVFISDSKDAGNRIQKWLATGGKNLSDRDAQITAVNQLTSHVKTHPHWWEDYVTLQRILTKLFA